MSLFYITMLLALFGVALPFHIFLSPQVAFEAGLISDQPPPCKLENPFEAHAHYQRNNADSGKSARFSHRQGYRCSRGLFDRKDRHTSYDFILHRSSKLLSELINQAIQQIKDDLGPSENIIWSVSLRDSVPPEMQPSLKAQALTSLTQALGPNRVARQSESLRKRDLPATALLNVGLRPLVDSQLLIEADVIVSLNGKKLSWNLSSP